MDPLPPHRQESPRARRVALVLAVLVSLYALIGVNHRAGKGRNALLKWAPAIEALEAGEPIYEVGAEGYPTLPLSILVLTPFHSAGPRFGPLLWALANVGLAWWIVTRALALAAGRTRDFPGWGTVIVLLLSFRVLNSELQHANINMLVGATVASAAYSYRRGQSTAAGLCLGLGAVLKVTPALGVLYFAWKRDVRALLGMVFGVVLFAYLAPGLSLGFERNADLVASWWRQMVIPYLGGRPLTLLQTEHINQSFLGVMSRHLTDSVAIPARPPGVPEDVSINWASLGAGSFRDWHMFASLGALLWCLLCVRPARDRRGPVVLAEFALLALAMVFLSERSWKHHYVLLVFPLALGVQHLFRCARDDPRFRIAAWGVGASAVLNGLTGDGILGDRGANLAEAYGAWLAGGLALYVASGLLLRRITTEESGSQEGVQGSRS